MTVKINFLQGGSYNAADLVAQFGALFTDGMLSGGSVAAHSPANLSVDVAALKCLKAGLFMNSDAAINVPIGANTSGYNRIDVIAADLDNQTIVAVQGTPSSSPTAPILTGNKIALCQVLVGNNVSVINTGNITDVRVNVDLFGSQLASKANIAQEGFIAPTLLNGYTAPFGPIRYFKDNFGIVHFKGRPQAPTTLGIMFNLPAGYRPPSAGSPSLFIAPCNDTGFAIIQINSVGDVYELAGSAGKWVGLDGITFRAEE